jgi:hypothetical protein
MVTRNLKCVICGHEVERTALRLIEPPRECPVCVPVAIMGIMPTAPAGFRWSRGCHKVDYPKSNEQLKKDYGLVEHDSTDPDSDYHQDGYAEEMVSKVPGVGRPRSED